MIQLLETEKVESIVFQSWAEIVES
jgi:hypothetical protein